MPYTLRALVARCDVFAETPAWIEDSVVIALPQGFCMIPLTQALRWQFGPETRPWLYATHGNFTGLPEGLVPHVAELSRRGPVSYLEAEYHGGDGEQRSIVWKDGAVLQELEKDSRAMQDALAVLGVERGEGGDCFDALDLGRRRSVDDWVAAAKPRPAPPVQAAVSAPVPPEPAPEPTRRPWWRFWR